MLVHVFNAGVRALAVSIILGGVLMFAVGGLDSPNARPLAGVIIVGFFIFWIVFIFLVGPRVPKPDERAAQVQDDHTNVPWGKRRRREEEPGDDADGTTNGGGD
jgi:hypothetical protein